MIKFSRRHLLQAGGAALTAWGVNRWQFDRYGKVLAQRTPRKLALLVGINQYSTATGPLYGCVNDAILQANLLVHRFGFNPADIVILDDAKATRQGILDAFEEHLIKQAKPGDVVVFHYSGHGSLVRDPNPLYVSRITGEGLSGSFVPVDANLPSTYLTEGGTVADIMGHTLFLLMSSIQTDNFTAVLDSCYAGATVRNLRVRSRDGGNQIQANDQETAYQNRWLRKFGWSPEEFVKRYREGIAKGIVLASTQPDQTALDQQFNGFVAGAFTYQLTQYLWQDNNSTPEETALSVGGRMQDNLQRNDINHSQKPKLSIEPGKPYGDEAIFFSENPRSPAQAVVIKKDGDRVTVLLGGIDPGLVNPGMKLTAIGGRGRVTLGKREQFWAEGTYQGRVGVGTLLRFA
ncbi:caspase family protein [Spirulina sp. 06S082]|uniref:caspase family protein n=1 Tax=Spirulina sp. 06S082 TaxID=3110248 RepID=UPI002B1FD345|nr:caspase family protein [Spirulina sp. 06S082]MEA5470788.1 caspase family protein [Spirulina sp. 06S082]